MTNDTRQEVVRTSSKNNRPLLILIGIFVVLVVIVFLFNKEAPVNWTSDYTLAMQTAKEVKKPLLLIFYRPNEPMVTDAFNNTYNKEDVQQFVNANFIAVLINTDDQPDLASRFDINYYPTIYIEDPNTGKRVGPRVGWDPPQLFIDTITEMRTRLYE
jgi:thiol:disulfide interchange protein DsbD